MNNNYLNNYCSDNNYPDNYCPNNYCLNKYYRIGNISFQIFTNNQLQIPKTVQLFEVTSNETYYNRELISNKSDYMYEFILVDKLPEADGKIIFQRDDMIVYQTPVGENRYIGIRNSNCWYAYYEELSACHAKVYIHQEYQDLCTNEVVFLSFLCLERRLLSNQNMIFHCSFLSLNGKGILLSGPSGVGKTTQANLWLEHTNAHVVNGDRGLLEWRDDAWHVSGWPVCGTSGICKNESWPLKAIFMLEQSDHNEAILLKGMAAFQEIYPQITLNRWNQEQAQQAFDLLNLLLTNIPIYKLKCTISKDAVAACLDIVGGLSIL